MYAIPCDIFLNGMKLKKEADLSSFLISFCAEGAISIKINEQVYELNHFCTQLLPMFDRYIGE